jgi:signal transduction histidine kinase
MKTNSDHIYSNLNCIFISGEDEGVFSPEESAILDALDQQLPGCSGIEQFTELLWQQINHLFKIDRLGISFIEKDGLRVTARLFKSSYKEIKLQAGYTALLNDSSLNRLLKTKEARIIPSLKAYLYEKPESNSTRLMLEEGIHTSITIPLIADNRRIGFLFISAIEPFTFTDHHVKLINSISSRIAQSIEKIWKIYTLEETRKDYAQLLGFVAHEMKSPLASIITLGHTYCDGYLGNVDPDAAVLVKKIISVSDYLVSMVNNYLGLSRLESGEMQVNISPEVNFKEQIFDVAFNTVSARLNNDTFNLNLVLPDKEISLPLDINLMRIAVINILDNATKYSSAHAKIDITLSLSGSKLKLAVQNEGVGFTPEQQKKLFQRFSRLQQSGYEDRKGTGLGLYLTWWIVQQHKGVILAESEPGKWARFTIELPGAMPIF